jgi:hypothetical protein
MFALQYDENGNWLDSPILVESVGTHEGPEYEDDIQAYQDLYASLESLCCYRDTLINLGGINQHYALEAYQHIPNWEEKVPKTYYSQHLSQVQYKVTMEGILQAFWETIKRLWEKLVALIKKGFYRLMGKPMPKNMTILAGLLKGPVTPEEAKEAEEHVRVMQYGIRKKKPATERFEHIVRQMQTTVHGKGFVMEMGGEKRQYASLNELLDDLFSQPEAPEIYRKFYFTTDPLWRDMVTNGPYTNYLTAISQELPNIVTSLNNQINLLETAIGLMGTPDQHAAEPVLQKLAGGSRKVQINQSEYSISDIADLLRKTRHDWIVQQHAPGDERDDITLFSQKTMHYWSTASLETMLESLIKATPDYIKLSGGTAKVGELLDKAKPHFTESNVGHTLRQAMEYVSSEAGAAASIALELGTYLNQHRLMVDHSYAMTSYFLRAIHPYLEKFGNNHGSMSAVVTSLAAIMSELKE